MRMFVQRILSILMLMALYSLARSQDTLINQKLSSVLPNYLISVRQRSNDLQQAIGKKEGEYVSKLQRIEGKLFERLRLIDSVTAKGQLEQSSMLYSQWKQRIQAALAPGGRQYVPHLDTLGTTLNYLESNPDLLKGISGGAGNLTQAIASVNALQSRMDQTVQMEDFVNQRQTQIKDILSQYNNLPSGLENQSKQFQQSAYYFGQQITEYKAILSSPKAAEQKAISVLSQMPACQRYLQNNSMLAALFRVPDNYSSSDALAGLQTREQLQGDLQARMSSGSGGGGEQFVQQKIQAAQQQLSQLKNRLNLPGLSGLQGNAPMPAFKPNSQHTKSIFQRLEYGANIQMEQAGGIWPATANLALLVGYKLSDQASFGVGMNYIAGLGDGIDHIVLSNQGVGWRSYFDFKAKKGIWITGGYEYNYMYAFKSLAQLKEPDLWQKSALLGVEKKYRLSKGRENNIQLLYDFLYKQHIPQSQPVVLRIGYSF